MTTITKEQVARAVYDAIPRIACVLPCDVRAALEEAVEAVKRARKIYLLGLGASYASAYDLFHKLRRAGFDASCYQDINMVTEFFSYLDHRDVVLAFSYSGLIEQLEYEGFSTSEATYAADNCGADWNEQAAKKAREYLDFMSFSRSGLIEQLEFEGFTRSQAEYGVNAVY